MSRGQVGNYDLEHLRLFTRPNGSLYSQIIIWVKTEELRQVDEALVALKEANPGASLSELVCSAVQAAGARARRENRRNRRAS